MLIRSMEAAEKAIREFHGKTSRENAYKVLCRLRTAGVKVISEYLVKKEMYREVEKRKRKADKVLPENIKVSIPNPYGDSMKEYKRVIAALGNAMFTYLDKWQHLGGTFGELCNLCNISESKGKQIASDISEQEYSKMMFICNLDYKNPGDWIEDTPEAPFTVCIKEYMLDIMLNTEHGAKAAHEALQPVFPELLDPAIILSEADGGFRYTDENGETHHIDKDGVEI